MRVMRHDPIFHSSDRKDIGERLLLTRQILGLSQAEFAATAGLKAAAMCRCERGSSRPSVDAATKLCEAYNLSLDWIFMGDLKPLPYDLADSIQKARSARRKVIPGHE